MDRDILPERGAMVEIQDQPQNPETEAPSKIAEKFAEARESVIAREAAEFKQIYKSIKEPGVKDVYNSWVRNMDVVANAQSLGREKPRLRTRVMKIANRVVGLAAAVGTGSADLVIDTITWLPRKVPVIRHFIPHDIFKKHTMRMAESAKRDVLVSQVVVGGALKAVDAGGAVVAGVLKESFIGHGPLHGSEVRAAGQYIGKKISNVTEGILHPKPKAPMKA